MVNKDRIKGFKNNHQGSRVFIIATGPSLNRTPLHRLKGEYTISLNKISHIFDETKWRPDYYVFDDAKQPRFKDGKMNESLKRTISKGVQQSGHSFVSAPGKRYFDDYEAVSYYKPNDNQHKLKEVQLDHISDINIDTVWQSDISKKINNFGSTISVTAQIAAYMGFDELYFLGCDLYEEPTKRYQLHPDGGDVVTYDFSHDHRIMKAFEMITDDRLSTVGTISNLAAFQILNYLPVDRAIDNNHFSEDYDHNSEYTVAEQWNQSLTKIHKVIQLASKKHGFDVYNATYGGRLEVYERVNLHDVLSE